MFTKKFIYINFFFFFFLSLQVNIVLLACSVLSFGLPVYMLYLGKKMRREQKVEAEKKERLHSQSSKALEPLLEDGIQETSEDGSEDVFLDEEAAQSSTIQQGSAMVWWTIGVYIRQSTLIWSV